MKYLLFVKARVSVAVTVMVVFLAGCWGGAAGKKPVGPTVPTEAPPPSTTAPPDVSSVPAVIDEAYLNEVLKALNKVDGDAMRLIVQEEDLVRPALDQLAAIYHEEEFNSQLRSWGRQLQEGLTTFRRPPGDKVNTVVRIISSRADCVYTETKEDYSAVSTSAGAPITMFIALQPKLANSDQQGFNTTAWMISLVGVAPDGTDPGLNPCG